MISDKLLAWEEGKCCIQTWNFNYYYYTGMDVYSHDVNPNKHKGNIQYKADNVGFLAT